jgi:uncharacterized protein YaaN involved in tellurite resistance
MPQVPPPEAFVLEPPRAVVVPTQEQALGTLVPLAPEIKRDVDAKVAERVNEFVLKIGAADLQSDIFRAMLDKAFAAGRKEVADTTNFINGNPVLKQANFSDYADSGEAKAMREISTILAKANPKGQDLMGPIKVLGITLPFGNKLRAYCDNFKPMGERLTELSQVLEFEEDNMRREIAEYDVVESHLYATVQRLDRATEYLCFLDGQLELEVQKNATINPEKSRALKEEVLYYVRDNLKDAGAVKLLAVVGLGQIRQLRHTGRMTLRATSRVRTLGLSALAIAQTMAIAAYKQKKRMELNAKVQNIVNEVVSGVGDTILEHTKMVTEFESNPIFGIQALEASIDKTTEAIKLFSTFRSAAVDTMKVDNLKLMALYDKTKTSMRITGQSAAAGRDVDVLSL